MVKYRVGFLLQRSVQQPPIAANVPLPVAVQPVRKRLRRAFGSTPRLRSRRRMARAA